MAKSKSQSLVRKAPGTFNIRREAQRKTQQRKSIQRVSATPEALKVLKDLAAGKGGSKNKASAQKELKKITSIRQSEGSFRRLSPTQAKKINQQLSKQLKQKSVIRSKEGIYRVRNQFFASRRAAEIFIDDELFKQRKAAVTSLVKKQAVPQLLKRLRFLTPQQQLEAIPILMKINNIDTKAKKISFLTKASNLLDLSIEKRKKLVSKITGIEKLKARPKARISKGSKLEKLPTKKQLKKLTKAERKRKIKEVSIKVGRTAVATGGLITLGFAKGVIGAFTVIRHPVETFKNIKKEFKEKGIKRVFLNELTRFGQNPFGVVAEYRGFGKTFKVAGGTVKGSKLGRAIKQEIFILRTPVALRSSVRAVLNAAARQKGIKIQKINVKQVKALKVKELNNVEIKATLDAMKKVDGVLFGSAAARILSKGRTKVPKDLDIAIPVSPVKFAREFIKRIPKKQRGLYKIKGEKIIKKGDRAFKIDVKPLDRLVPQRNFFTRKGKLPVAGVREVSKVAQDIKKIITLNKEIVAIRLSLKLPGKTVKAKALLRKRLKTKLKQASKLKRGLKLSELPKKTRKVFENQLTKRTEKLVKVGGIKLIGFSEQTTRKALGTLQVLLEKNVRRAKDPQAFVEALQIQVQVLKSQKPKTKLGKLLRNRRVKKLQESIKILTSKKFQRLLEKQAPGITKEFPILKKLSVPKLKKVKKLSLTNLKNKLKKVSQIKRKKVTKKKVTKKKKARRVTKKKVVKRKSKLPSKLPKSKLPLSKLPLSRLSRLPPSKIPKSVLVKASKLPSIKLSKLPNNILSRLPLKVLSKLPPSKLKSVLSKLPKTTRSKLPASILKKAGVSRIPKLITKRKTPPPPKPNIKKAKDKIKKLIDKAERSKKFIYTADLTAVVLGQASKLTAAQKKRLSKTIFTGIGRRLIIKKKRGRR